MAHSVRLLPWVQYCSQSDTHRNSRLRIWTQASLNPKPGLHGTGTSSHYFPVAACVCAQPCPTLCDPMGCSLPGSSVHGILQARILERVAISYSNCPLVGSPVSLSNLCPCFAGAHPPVPATEGVIGSWCLGDSEILPSRGFYSAQSSYWLLPWSKETKSSGTKPQARARYHKRRLSSGLSASRGACLLHLPRAQLLWPCRACFPNQPAWELRPGLVVCNF